MRIVNAAVATVMLVSGPVPASASHAVQALPATPHVQVVPAAKTVTAKKFGTPLHCSDAWAGWDAWLPGQVAPYILAGDTSAAVVYYEAPAGFVILVKRIERSTGTSSVNRMFEVPAGWTC